ncbi:MAG: restriction endonuclease [Acidimicrobiia bacterium]
MILDGKEGRILVQAKQWKANKVGVPKVRELLGVYTAQRASGAILVTSGRATDEARRFALANGISVVEGEELERMIRQLQQHPSVESSRAQQAETTRIRTWSPRLVTRGQPAARLAPTGRGCSTHRDSVRAVTTDGRVRWHRLPGGVPRGAVVLR